MKKLLLLILTLSALLGLAACSNAEVKTEPKSQQTNEKAMKTEINQVKTINDIDMEITGDKIVKDDTLKTDQVLLEVSFDIKNNSKSDYGVGSGDYYVKDKDGKKYPMYGNEDNFGAVVKTGKELKGKGYYAIPKGSEDLVVVYDKAVDKSKSEKTLEWNIGTPK
ncbi:DUF4352 domain-containing protein [Listeria monocytogenes]|uniref:DUF4352 domain-containing protein n=1 Tax=Listeria monocytogenes TaxID=1639 RepID=UPI0010B8D339|nr:DUF4352 domain-containing protein [Listeria monocytogenes]EAC3456728.1 DUF4352 domain-containing protein [Listeria monocytogenes]EAC4365694.1 DUF4352 domain-containing protein [Listeria monocytogenes]EAC4830989.1 DUF4352 domain-containing protein [Listeria monocytogenes]EAC8844351.1 DUF4352 domain-containing protein [Listeria monocytogenes]EAD0273359.1 DUF4352 domain-containing protein [Listeria monocytogenes]